LGLLLQCQCGAWIETCCGEERILIFFQAMSMAMGSVAFEASMACKHIRVYHDSGGSDHFSSKIVLALTTNGELITFVLLSHSSQKSLQSIPHSPKPLHGGYC